MLYGKLIGGAIQFAPPEIYDDNGVVTFLKGPSDYYDNGYKVVRRMIPEYDPRTQKLLFNNITEDDTTIYVNYIVNDLFDYIIKEEANM